MRQTFRLFNLNWHVNANMNNTYFLHCCEDVATIRSLHHRSILPILEVACNNGEIKINSIHHSFLNKIEPLKQKIAEAIISLDR